jgi:hypothetical protein
MMAGYLSRLPPPEPRAAQPKRSPAASAGTPTVAGTTPAAGTNPVAGANPAEASKQQPRQQPTNADQAKSAQVQPKGRRPGVPAEARPLSQPPIEESLPAPIPLAEPPAPAQLSATAPAAAPRPLVPFQE